MPNDVALAEEFIKALDKIKHLIVARRFPVAVKEIELYKGDLRNYIAKQSK